MPSPGDPQSFNRYSYVLNSPLRYTDPSGHCIPGVDCPQEFSETGGMIGFALPCFDRLTGPREIPQKSREALYVEAYNLGLAPWQDNPNGSIDDRFNPFYSTDESGNDRSTERYVAYLSIADALYEGNSSRLPGLVIVQCDTNGCNNPLNDKDNPVRELDLVSGANAVYATTSLAERVSYMLFLQEIGAGWEAEYYMWNYEPLWLFVLMNEHQYELREAQWAYLEIYEESGETPEIAGGFPELAE